ncbi:helix-turn-helix domain-containing protein [Streptomyces acidicola]|uniref:Helix-turn-helix transcriptional regulator n=1 Tax=Streptomyces acidicola TaxID=2596892 RepID=A0A5N8WLD6_9ACTN|nr:helix-turn-helix transcriptional regulator [Streptomyces acidicola]MPY47195.1 helix-turn-helix transcriptional regulator [Streptomyces acidicola]MPY47334.1 helix-turn-helix transcriptional regulator [Streptomyces acidicola]
MPHLPDDDAWLLERRRAIGDRIRVTRLRQNMTQEALHLSAGLSRATLQGIEAGTRDARISSLIKIARVLGVHVTDLLRGY